MGRLCAILRIVKMIKEGHLRQYFLWSSNAEFQDDHEIRNEWDVFWPNLILVVNLAWEM